ncbi:hypothetical protein K470DRAFT_256290, partial [Piedraia hortae CBS 480.64]
MPSSHHNSSNHHKGHTSSKASYAGTVYDRKEISNGSFSPVGNKTKDSMDIYRKRAKNQKHSDRGHVPAKSGSVAPSVASQAAPRLHAGGSNAHSDSRVVSRASHSSAPCACVSHAPSVALEVIVQLPSHGTIQCVTPTASRADAPYSPRSNAVVNRRTHGGRSQIPVPMDKSKVEWETFIAKRH